MKTVRLNIGFQKQRMAVNRAIGEHLIRSIGTDCDIFIRDIEYKIIDTVVESLKTGRIVLGYGVNVSRPGQTGVCALAVDKEIFIETVGLVGFEKAVEVFKNILSKAKDVLCVWYYVDAFSLENFKQQITI